MDPTAALIAGLAAGLAIAMQFGAVSLLLVETALLRGTRTGVAAGMGVATVDLLFAAAAAAAGAAAGAVLAEHEPEVRLVAAATLAGIALHGLLSLRSAPPGAVEDPAAAAGLRVHYLRFFAITLVNPLTIASFAAVAASLPLGAPGAAAAFAAGVGVASAAWHLMLSVAAGHAGRWVTPRIRTGLAVGGRVAILGFAAHLALSG
jgi:threonine/homoserine/homoserine lactone efflux protein